MQHITHISRLILVTCLLNACGGTTSGSPESLPNAGDAGESSVCDPTTWIADTAYNRSPSDSPDVLCTYIGDVHNSFANGTVHRWECHEICK